jgi:hypothetical protein
MKHLLNSMLEKISTDTLAQLSYQIDKGFRKINTREHTIDDSTLFPLWQMLVMQTHRKYEKSNTYLTYGDLTTKEVELEIKKRISHE